MQSVSDDDVQKRLIENPRDVAKRVFRLRRCYIVLAIHCERFHAWYRLCDHVFWQIFV